jgi:hypothetical protein
VYAEDEKILDLAALGVFLQYMLRLLAEVQGRQHAMANVNVVCMELVAYFLPCLVSTESCVGGDSGHNEVSSQILESGLEICFSDLAQQQMRDQDLVGIYATLKLLYTISCSITNFTGYFDSSRVASFLAKLTVSFSAVNPVARGNCVIWCFPGVHL